MISLDSAPPIADGHDEEVAAEQERQERYEARKAAVDQLVEHLPPRRKAVAERYFQGELIADIAQALELSRSAVDNQLFYVRKMLAALAPNPAPR
jgi:RNA polymerase sigma factor (sigma-70 family)